MGRATVRAGGAVGDGILTDLGERRILAEIIPQFAQSTGDDCAEISVSAGSLIVTMDPVPQPAARVIGKDDNPYWMGWLLVAINASDIAAGGGRPRGFLASLDLPNDWPVANLNALLAGIRDGCAANEMSYVGGNLREAATLSATGVALGECVGYPPLRRSGARAGDAILCLGQGGQFWCDALHVRAGGTVDKDRSPLFRPVTQAPVMWKLARDGLITSAMDTSDGFAPALHELAAKSQLRFVVDPATMTGHVDHGGFFDAPRNWFGWGDWTVIATAAADDVEAICTRATAEGSVAYRIGSVMAGPAGASLRGNGGEVAMPTLDSERFSHDSWMSVGIDRYIDQLLSLELT